MYSPLRKADTDLGSLGWARAAFGTGKQQQLRVKDGEKKDLGSSMGDIKRKFQMFIQLQ